VIFILRYPDHRRIFLVGDGLLAYFLLQGGRCDKRFFHLPGQREFAACGSFASLSLIQPFKGIRWVVWSLPWYSSSLFIVDPIVDAMQQVLSTLPV
jgi:hypothetical protein